MDEEIIEDLKDQIDSLGEAHHPCASCGESTLVEEEHIATFDPKYHYCGTSPRCIP